MESNNQKVIQVKRKGQIDALIRRAHSDFENLKTDYDRSLEEKQVAEDLKVSIKNIFENLRSCLDYLAHEIHENHCSHTSKPKKLYFPIRVTQSEFNAVMDKDFKDLELNSKSIFDILGQIQPFNDPWLRKFNKLNNKNKHEDLTPQSRREEKRVEVSNSDGKVSWGTGVTFGSGVSVMGVPIDPRTQLPVPNESVKTEITTWVSFSFSETGDLVIPFIKDSISKVDTLCKDVQKYL